MEIEAAKFCMALLISFTLNTADVVDVKRFRTAVWEHNPALVMQKALIWQVVSSFNRDNIRNIKWSRSHCLNK